MSESKKIILRKKMPYFIEFARFSVGFVVMIVTALALLHVVALAASA